MTDSPLDDRITIRIEIEHKGKSLSQQAVLSDYAHQEQLKYYLHRAADSIAEEFMKTYPIEDQES